MSNPSVLGQILYEAETLWGEAVNTFATLQLPICSPVDCSGLTQAKIDSARTGAYMHQGYQYILGPMGGSFKFKVYLPGHGSTTVGATTINAFETFMAWVIGNGVVSASAGTTASAGTATSITTVASGTFTAGSLTRIGTLGDGRNNGQVVPIASHTTTTLVPLVALQAAPSSGDVISSGVNLYPSETLSGVAITSARFRLMTGNMVYDCHGCYAKSATVMGTEIGGRLMAEIEIGVSWFEEKGSVTYPATTTRVDSQPGINAGGSLHVSDSGTATRGDRTKARGFSVALTLGIEPQMGYGGYSPYQTIVAARRVPSKVMVSWVEDADAQTATPALVGFGTGTTFKQVMWTGCPVDQKTVAFYAPYVAVTERPTQISEGPINAFKFTGEAMTGPTTTSDLTLSAWRWFLG